ncbi:superoxide dismutase family protein [Erythrobacter sp. HL-111]|uniref:superoxide dismutase family protein n=1 Tax=Erythrobacter sp. HL-111 TaxID=1798193 RepID=UPI0006D99239|nr:superoxide dismutase family protein [Erythrobacter sp. HL-111]KPP90159.1 MAG: Cu-Zn family superoxide dismutase Sod1 [Erythrobacteraceae bacterium HL-111]SDR82568.1 superoxide dismutase, Cu-Zn family [Erythrobacter sp. HL-111]
MFRSLPLSAIAVPGVIALAAVPLAAQSMQGSAQVEAQLRTADGLDAGTVTFEQAEHGVLIVARLKNLGEGAHGFHIHETGTCTPDFKAAGGHYDPVGSEHGFDNEDGYHVGDLPNVHVGEDGTATSEFHVPQVTLRGPDNGRYPFTLADGDGSTIMVHARADDYRTMASAGDRVACGVIFAERG